MEPIACTPASDWEKGQVENQGPFLRGRLGTPKLTFKEMESLNAGLYLQCEARGSRPNTEQQDQTIDAVFAEEKAELRPLGRPFDG